MDGKSMNRQLRAIGTAGFIILASCHSFALAEDNPPPAADSTDWPSTISRLQQEVYQQPGFARSREQLAIAYNNYGVELGNQGKWDLAVSQLQESLRVDNTNQQAKDNLARIYLNHAYAVFKLHQMQDALEAVDQAIRAKPDFGPAYALKGEIEYGTQKLKEAKASWERSLQLDPSQQEVVERLKQLAKELPIETEFERLSQASFDVRYQEGLQESIGFDVRDVLLEARREVGSDFAYWPKHKVVVLVYSAESFRAMRQETPEWVGGQFDGKIRVPLPNRQISPEMVRQILYHEYTHAVIYDLTDGNCPIWLNEGLAEYEGRKQFSGPLTQLSSAYQQEKLVAWSNLSEHFSVALPADVVGLAYQEAYSVCSYLVQRYGFWRVRRILKAIDEGKTWENVLPEEFHLKLKTLESSWQRWLPEFLQSPA